MATDLENIVAARSALLARLAAEAANPKPSYSIDGQSVSWDSWRSAIMSQIDGLNSLLASVGGAFEEIGQGTT